MSENEETVQEESIEEEVNLEPEVEGEEEISTPDVEEDEFEKLTAERDDLQDKFLRLAAEFDNYKKRTARDRVAALKYAEENLLKELLPAIDNIERAVEQGEKDDPESTLLEGVQMTLKGLVGALGKFEVKAMASLGETFDPNVHEALAMDFSKEYEENRVMVEFEKGYHYKDKLLRAAKVVVSKGEDK